MSQKVASLFVEVGAKIDGAVKGLQSVEGEITKAGGSFSNLGSIATKAMVGIGAAIGAAVAAFEVGEFGSHVLQAESSFDHLLDTVGGAPNTLAQMRAAAQGTASDLDLMRSASSLLAGTTGELGQAFADALPELTGIARAAAILNPEIGSTGEAMNRLALGIKKAEPELLDEMGILLNLNTVFREYGASVGKSANELTKTEKSQAMLNAVLQQGSVLAEQAAGAIDQSALSIDRMQASVDNAQAALAARFAPAVAAAADEITGILTPASQVVDNLGEQQRAALITSSSYDDYRKSLDKAAQAAGYFVDESGNLARTVMSQHGPTRYLEQANYALSEAQYAAAQSAIALGEATGADMNELTRMTEAVGMSDQAVQAWGDRLQGAALASEEYQQRLTDMQIAAVALAAGLEGTLGNALESYGASLTELTAQEATLTDEMQRLLDAGLSPTSQKYQELTAALDQNRLKQEEALASLQGLTAEMIYQQAAAGLDTQAALDLARSMGVLSEADYAVATVVQSLRAEFDKNADSMIDASEGAQQYAASVDLATRAVQSLQAKNVPVTVQNIASEMEALAKADAEGALTGAATAAEEGEGPLSDFGGAALEAADGAGDLASSAEDAGSGLSGLPAAASRATNALNSLRTPITSLINPLERAGNAANDLGSGLRNIPNNIRSNVSITGVDQAISQITRLNTAIGSIPQQVTINIETTGGGTTPAGPTPTASVQAQITPVSAPAGQAQPSMTTTEIYNIYNPLAAAIVMEQKRIAAVERLERRMA